VREDEEGEGDAGDLVAGLARDLGVEHPAELAHGEDVAQRDASAYVRATAVEIVRHA
jgi:hypothetical protein